LLKSDKLPLLLKKLLVLLHQIKTFMIPSIILEKCWTFYSKIIQIKAIWLTFPTGLMTTT